METSEEQSSVIEIVSLAKGTFPIIERDPESTTPTPAENVSQIRRQATLGAAFRGSGLNITWDKNDEENKRVNFMPDTLDDILEGDEGMEEEEEKVLENDDFDENASTKKCVPGNGIKDKYVFVLETLSDRHCRLALAIVYVVFAAYYVVGFAYERRIEEEVVPLAVIPENASDEDLTCIPKPDKSCIPMAGELTPLTVGQVYLLANTVVVSDGIDPTDWLGNGVKPGTPPFSAFSEGGLFLADPSTLEFSANSDLHPVWDDIVAVLWIGHINTYQFNTFRDFSFTIKLHNIGGDWPDNIADIPLRLNQDVFTCVRGGEGFCDSIGNWRAAAKIRQVELPPVTVKGNELSIEIGYDEEFDFEVLDRYASRIVLTKFNGESVVSDCIRDNSCIPLLDVRGTRIKLAGTVWVLFCYQIIYVTFFIWWINSLVKRKGAPKMWPSEDVWLIPAGLGFIFKNNIFLLVLKISMRYSETFVLSQRTHAAAGCLVSFGTAMFVFSLICFIDAPRKYVATKIGFYGYKIFFVLLFFICDVIIIVNNYSQASGRDEPGTDEELGRVGFKTNTYLWNSHDRFVQGFALTAWFILVTIGFVYYMWKAIVGMRLLAKLPYGMTRHTQLSFRFFLWVSLPFVFMEYILKLTSFISEQNSSENEYIWAANVAHGEYMNLSIATSTFLLFFILILQVFFLPLCPNITFGKRRTHYFSKDDMTQCPESKRSKSTYPMFLDQAKLLCICSLESYLPMDDDELLQMISLKRNEKPQYNNKSIESSLGRTSSLKESLDNDSENDNSTNIPGLRLAGDAVDGQKMNATISSNSTWAQGCRVVARIREPGGIDIHDTRVLILRHELSGDLIVSFRGTATTKQIKTDLMISKVTVCLDNFLTVDLSNWREKTRKKIKSKTDFLSHAILGDLNAGKVSKVRLIDLLPKANKSLPPYLKDAHKDHKRIPGRGKIHFGFWSSYNRVREEVHKIVREELLERPGRLVITGHSLGGAQATLCAYDMCRWVVPTIKRQILYQVKGGRAHADKISVSCYTFGSPKVGGPRFAAAYNEVVPNTQRIVCDGDVITAGPSPFGYHHVRRENIFDFTGVVRVEPGLMEKSFSLKSRSKANSHFLTNYLKVIKKSFDPVISEEELLKIMRKAYGIKKK